MNRAQEKDVVKRWSAKARQELVIRMLRGESIEELSRETEVETYRLEQWRNLGLKGIEESLKSSPKNNASEKALDEARKTIGRLTMELELFRGKSKRRMR